MIDGALVEFMLAYWSSERQYDRTTIVAIPQILNLREKISTKRYDGKKEVRLIDTDAEHANDTMS